MIDYPSIISLSVFRKLFFVFPSSSSLPSYLLFIIFSICLSLCYSFVFFHHILLGGLSTTDHLLISLEFSFFIRWSVDDRSPIDFVRIFFLYSFFILYFYFFRTLFCAHVYSKLTWSISFNFLSVIKPYDFKFNLLFQGH